MINSFSSCDSSGKNILHYLSEDYLNYNDSEVLNKILTNKNINSFINKKIQMEIHPIIIS